MARTTYWFSDTPICLHLQYPFNLMAMILAISLILVSLIKDRKIYNKFNFLGMFIVIIGLIVGVAMIMGRLTDFSLSIQVLGSIGMLFLGTLLIGVGNHIKNPEKVPKKPLIIGAIFSCSLLLYFWLLLKLSSR